MERLSRNTIELDKSSLRISANTAGAKIGFIDFNLAGLRVMKIHTPGRS